MPAAAQIGVNVNRLFNDGIYSQPQIDAQLGELAAAGARTARSDALWEFAEPSPPEAAGRARYDWRFDDEIAVSLRRHGLSWLPIIDYAPAWASARPDLPHALPSDPRPYAAFAAALAVRYDAAAYEIWNEPDNRSFAGPVPDPARYGTLYEAARTAILAVRPEARVLIGGLSHSESFLPALIHAHPELVGHIDGVAVHPYAPNPAAVVRAVVRERSVLAQLGLGSTPLYVTELGWTTRPPGALSYAPASVRAAYIAAALDGIAASSCGVESEYLYTWITPRRDPRNSEDWFGISGVSADVAALAAAVRAAASGPSAAGASRCP
jgi:hypothetical protein